VDKLALGFDMSNFLNDLNAAQLQAVHHSNGPLIITAGPGTGKTKTLTAKILYLLTEKNLAANQILALTFTKKAALEIQDRLRQLSIVKKNLPLVTTFHALAHRFLSTTDQPLSLISKKNRVLLIKEIVQNQRLSQDFSRFSAKELSLLISRWKNLSLNEADLEPVINKLIKSYQAELENRKLLDFDDLLVNFLEILNSDADKNKNQQLASAQLHKLRKKYRYLLIDEYQDTNNIQYQLIKSLINKENNLVVIGDPRQAIYSFRGANAHAFDQFKIDFPNFQEINLQDNYRSGPEILNLSQSLFKKKLKLQAKQKIVSEVKLIKTYDEYSEAKWILKSISQKVGGLDFQEASELQASEQQARFADFAVIYRIHGLSHALENKFDESGIPYQIVGGRSLYEKSEIKFITDFLRFLNSQEVEQIDREELFNNLLESKYSALSKKTVTKIRQLAQDLNFSIHKSAGKIINQKLLSKKQATLLADFLANLATIELQFKKNIGEGKFSLAALVDLIISKFNLEEKSASKVKKIKNLYEFKSIVTAFDQEEKSLLKFINFLDSLKEHDYYDKNVDKVTLLTMHAAKGLEFDYVFICGFEEGLIPFSKKLKDKAALAEEKRLLYVAMTRAKKGLYLINTEKRNKKQSQVSSFKNYFTNDDFIELEDETLIRIKKWQQKKKKESSQLGLF
jgi:DNA helicase-2/ATP-dependent DNA helicase PcrA